MWESKIMLAFWGDNKAITARKYADCTIPWKRLRYSNRAVSNSIITVTEALSRQYNSHIKGKIPWYSNQLNEEIFEAETLV